jgi:hypothetical protein
MRNERYDRHKSSCLTQEWVIHQITGAWPLTGITFEAPGTWTQTPIASLKTAKNFANAPTAGLYREGHKPICTHVHGMQLAMPLCGLRGYEIRRLRLIQDEVLLERRPLQIYTKDL